MIPATAVVVCDASALVAVLLDAGADGRWATEALRGRQLAAPDLLPFETANVIRRHERSGLIGADAAAQAHADLRSLTVELWPYELLATRAWELRHDLTVYDGAYVALAETLDATLVTLDRAIVAVPGIGCSVSVPAR